MGLPNLRYVLRLFSENKINVDDQHFTVGESKQGQFANSNAGCGGKQEHVMSLLRTGPSYRIFCFFNSLAISLTTPSMIVCADFGLNESLVPVQMSSPSAAVVA
jgi:hypothetical protein